MRALRGSGNDRIRPLSQLDAGLGEAHNAFEGIGLDDPAGIGQQSVEHCDRGRQLTSVELKPRHQKTDMPAHLGQRGSGQVLKDFALVAAQHLGSGDAHLLEDVHGSHVHQRVGKRDRLPQLLGPVRVTLNLLRHRVRLTDGLPLPASQAGDEAAFTICVHVTTFRTATQVRQPGRMLLPAAASTRIRSLAWYC